ncbi:MAG TPA: hypothetical protein DCX07_06430 [Phycisphaerales bacterium]|nr:hypothetical protein [Phycisphaerales bacterium]
MLNYLSDQPIVAYVALAFAELALAAVWYERRSRKIAWLLLAPPLLAAGVFAVSVLVTTDRQQIVHACREMARDVVANRADSLNTYLTDDFLGVYHGARLDKPGAMAMALGEKTRFRVKEITVNDWEIGITGDQATVTVETEMRLETAELGGAAMKVFFYLNWVRRPEGWRLRSADEPRIGAARLEE